MFAWYTLDRLDGDRARRAGGGHASPRVLQQTRIGTVSAYRTVVILYAALGVVLAVLVLPSVASGGGGATSARRRVDADDASRACPASTSRAMSCVKLSALFALDSFGGGFVVQSFAAYWFYLRFGVDPGTLGAIFFWANVLAGTLGAAGVAAGRALRPDQDDGRDAPAVERPADSRAADADAAARHRGAAACGSASARWTCRRGSPTSWRS